jgi:alpha-galactosidase
MVRTKVLGCALAAVLVIAGGGALHAQKPDTVWLSSLDLAKVRQGWGSAVKDTSLEGKALSIGGRKFARGVATHAKGKFYINLNTGSERFIAFAGVDDDAIGGVGGSVDFQVYGDDSLLWKSTIARTGWPPQKVDVSVKGVKMLLLKVGDAGDGISYDHADWADAKLIVSGARPEAYLPPVEQPYILTPKPPPEPKINGPKVYGVRPGHSLLYTVAATGERPMEFSAEQLPPGVRIDKKSGRLQGAIEAPGTCRVTLMVTNSRGSARRELRIVVGNTVALTPPLGWNSWNCFAGDVDDKKVRAAADAMVASGLINHGWSYINIDDCWMVQAGSQDPVLGGMPRTSEGRIISNKKFPDMKKLSDYVHGKGLKLGIYTSPGPQTCAGFTGAYKYEQQDAEQFAAWGIDYLKYDWCSYDEIAKDHSLRELQKPYQVMRAALDRVDRDIVYSLCQYGMGDVWEWGEQVGGNCWRTTGDINDSWGSVEEIGFNQAGKEKFAGPGHWNDPDMLVVGQVGWGPKLHPTNLSPNEQYTHITLWSLLAAPLLIGCDMTQMDDFTLNLLTNDEVLEVHQDPLGHQAKRVLQAGDLEVWSRDLEDGSKAVGLFNRGEKQADVGFLWSDLGINGQHTVRDLWRQKDVGLYDREFKAPVPSHGATLLKLTVPEKP